MLKKLSKFKKMMVGFLGVAVMMVGMNHNVWARDVSNTYSVPALTAGSWWSGFGYGQLESLTSTYPTVDADDVGMYLYTTDVSLPESFVQTTSRTVEIELKEADEGNNTSETPSTYRGYFNFNANGDYVITRFFQATRGTECIETNNIVEMYIRAKVNTASGDSSRNVPANIFRYAMWVN